MSGSAVAKRNDSVLKGLNRPQISIWLTVLASVALIYAASPAMDGSGDPDYYWHMMYARWILEKGAIPSTDFISWPFAGQTYLLTQWLGQVLIGLADKAGESEGRALLTLGTVMTTVCLSWAVAKQKCEDTTTAFLIAMAASATFWSTYARPQMFSFVAMTALIWLLERARTSGWGAKSLLGVAAVMAAWVNLHGSYVVGLVYIALLGLSEVTEQLFAMQKKEVLRLVMIRWAGVLAIALLATLANPNGWRAWAYVVEIAGLQSTTTGIIMEWAPTSFGTGVGSSYILLLLGTIMAMAISRERPTTRDLVVVAGMGIFGLMASRQAFYSTLVMIPLVAFYGSRTQVGDLLAKKLKPTIPLWLGIGSVLTCAAIGQYSNGIRSQGLENWKKRIFPVSAAKFINENGLRGRVFNEVTSGGYLAYETGLPVYVDGRMDLYKDKHFFEWFYARMGSPSWKGKMQEVDADIFVLQNQSALTQLLMQSGEYAMVHADSTYAVLVPKKEKFADLISRNSATQPKFKIFDSEGRLLVTPMGY